MEVLLLRWPEIKSYIYHVLCVFLGQSIFHLFLCNHQYQQLLIFPLLQQTINTVKLPDTKHAQNQRGVGGVGGGT